MSRLGMPGSVAFLLGFLLSSGVYAEELPLIPDGSLFRVSRDLQLVPNLTGSRETIASVFISRPVESKEERGVFFQNRCVVKVETEAHTAPLLLSRLQGPDGFRDRLLRVRWDSGGMFSSSSLELRDPETNQLVANVTCGQGIRQFGTLMDVVEDSPGTLEARVLRSTLGLELLATPRVVGPRIFVRPIKLQPQLQDEPLPLEKPASESGIAI